MVLNGSVWNAKGWALINGEFACTFLHTLEYVIIDLCKWSPRDPSALPCVDGRRGLVRTVKQEASAGAGSSTIPKSSGQGGGERPSISDE